MSAIERDPRPFGQRLLSAMADHLSIAERKEVMGALGQLEFVKSMARRRDLQGEALAREALALARSQGAS